MSQADDKISEYYICYAIIHQLCAILYIKYIVYADIWFSYDILSLTFSKPINKGIMIYLKRYS